MTIPKKRGSKPTVTLFKSHPKIDTKIIERIHIEAGEEIAVLDVLQELGGKASTYQIKRKIPTLTKVKIEKALKRQLGAENVRLVWECRRLVWELV